MDRLQEAIADTQAFKQEIYDAIIERAPKPESRLGFTVNFSDIVKSDGMVLSAEYYDTGSQLRRLAAFVIEDKRSLKDIFRELLNIADVGLSSFKDTPSNYNPETREIIRSLF